MLVVGASVGLAGETAAPLRVMERHAIGGRDIAYDYLRLDPGAKRLYVSHGSLVEVLDSDSGKVVGQIRDTAGVHGIALAPAFNHGFTSNGTDRSVTMFDLQTLAPLKVIKYTGVKPDSIEYDPQSKHVFVVNGASTGDVTVIAPETGDIVDTVPLKGGKLEQIAFDGRGRGYVNDEGQNVIHVFDTTTMKPLAAWPLAPCEGPTGLAVDTGHHRLFAACGNRLLAVVNSDSGAVVATAPIGLDPDGAAFDADRKLIFTSNRDATLSVLHEDSPDSYSVLQTVVTESGARTLALDAASGRVFLPAAKFEPAPRPTQSDPEPRARMIPGSFVILVVGN